MSTYTGWFDEETTNLLLSTCPIKNNSEIYHLTGNDTYLGKGEEYIGVVVVPTNQTNTEITIKKSNINLKFD